MLRKILFLAIASAITIIATIVQQIISSDSPYRVSTLINSTDYSFKLPVLHEGNDECLIELNIPDTAIRGTIYYKIYKSSQNWNANALIRLNDNLVSILPHNKPNIKIEYYIELSSKGKIYPLAKEKPVVVRFQSIVPKPISYLHVVILFLAIILSCFTGILTITEVGSYKKYARLTFYFLAGSIVLGLAVHLISFRHLFLQINQYNDLSFYKYLVIVALWSMVFYLDKHKTWWFVTLLVSLVTLLLYCLPQNVLLGYLQ